MLPLNQHRTGLVWFMVFHINISSILWQSALLLEESGENHRPIASNWQTISHNVVSSAPRHERG